jgi:cytochrome c-type biogenesis protein CcmH/NrfF
MSAASIPTDAAARAYDQAATTILCDCGCHPQSVKECACGRAEEMRTALAAEARSGKSGDEIVAGYVARYGEKILVAPPAKGFNLVAWTGPAIGLLGAAFVIVAMIRRWRRISSELPPAPPGNAPDDADLVRLRRQVEDLR